MFIFLQSWNTRCDFHTLPELILTLDIKLIHSLTHFSSWNCAGHWKSGRLKKLNCGDLLLIIRPIDEEHEDNSPFYGELDDIYIYIVYDDEVYLCLFVSYEKVTLPYSRDFVISPVSIKSGSPPVVFKGFRLF